MAESERDIDRPAAPGTGPSAPPVRGVIAPDFATLPRREAASARRPLIGLTRAAMRDALIDIGVPEKQARMRTGQLWAWIYQRGTADFAEMTTISKGLRADLDAAFTLARPEIVTRQLSRDGTRK
ncbi:MAG: 23S rRNA (adenine(2503)-C(2))-methyltransferase RlmN, partial [Pseudomonadota bacterium]